MKITICGSMKFAKEMAEARKVLEEKGHKVFVGPLVNHYICGKIKYTKGKEGARLKIAHDLIRAHFRKIEKSDAVLVLNYSKDKIKNYIGGNTLMEVGYAFYLGKKIYFLNPIPNQSYKEELMAMEPIVLNNDLSKLLEKKCDHTSVGMHVWRRGKLLLIERKKFPFGFAPPAGHVDDRSSFEEAARIELEEEVGLKVKNLKLIFEGRKNNPCRRKRGTWHYWKIYEVETEGKVRRSLDETKQTGWYSKKEIEELAKRTQRYIDGKISKDDWEKSPGLEVVWYQWMKELRVI